MKKYKLIAFILTLIMSFSLALEVRAAAPSGLTFKVIDDNLTEIYGSMKDGHITVKKVALYNSNGTLQSYAYNIEPQKNQVAGNEKSTSIKATTDYGYQYLIQNGYPNKSLGYGDDGDYYTTQLALWMYAYKVYGASEDDKLVGYLIDANGEKSFHFTGATNTANRQTKIAQSAYELYKKALSAHNSGKTAKSYKLSHSVASNEMLVEDGKLISRPVTVTLDGAAEYNVSFNVKNVVAVSTESGNVKTSFRVAEKFRVRYEGDIKDFQVKATITAKDPNVIVYEVKPEGNAKSLMISTFLDSDGSSLSDEVYFNFDANRTTICNQDKNSGKEIAGATLVIKDLHGNKVATWITTTEAHYEVLEPGTYTLEETIAPTGYIKPDTGIQFTVKGDGTDEVTMLNEKLAGVDVSNLDDTGEAELSGVTLVVYNQEGKEVATWVTTEKKYHLVLNPGEYTMKETSVPGEYELNKDIVSFTILANGSAKEEVVMHNELKAIPVPITGSVRSIIMVVSSLILVICGTLLLYDGYTKRKSRG